MRKEENVNYARGREEELETIISAFSSLFRGMSLNQFTAANSSSVVLKSVSSVAWVLARPDGCLIVCVEMLCCSSSPPTPES